MHWLCFCFCFCFVPLSYFHLSFSRKKMGKKCNLIFWSNLYHMVKSALKENITFKSLLIVSTSNPFDDIYYYPKIHMYVLWQPNVLCNIIFYTSALWLRQMEKQDWRNTHQHSLVIVIFNPDCSSPFHRSQRSLIPFGSHEKCYFNLRIFVRPKAFVKLSWRWIYACVTFQIFTTHYKIKLIKFHSK